MGPSVIPPLNPNNKVRLVFHGTSEANIAPICRDGLDTSKRGKNGQVRRAHPNLTYPAPRPHLTPSKSPPSPPAPGPLPLNPLLPYSLLP